MDVRWIKGMSRYPREYVVGRVGGVGRGEGGGVVVWWEVLLWGEVPPLKNCAIFGLDLNIVAPPQ